jgi:hypothetical protein
MHMWGASERQVHHPVRVAAAATVVALVAAVGLGQLRGLVAVPQVAVAAKVAPAGASSRGGSVAATPPAVEEPDLGVGSDPGAAAVEGLTVLLYGDSLASEAEGHLRTALARVGVVAVEGRTRGGSALCDWLDAMRADAVRLPPPGLRTLVVIEFSGNALTPCTAGLDGRSLAFHPDALEARYAEDAAEVVSIFSAVGARVLFAGSPVARGADPRGEPFAARLNRAYADLADRTPGVDFVDAGAAVLRDGRWTESLPCLPEEPCTGRPGPDGQPENVVRAPDGGHFCPGSPAATAGMTAACPVWSSGAYRYGLAIADGVVRSAAARW